jgi:hypothetical protein
MSKQKLEVLKIDIRMKTKNQEDFICLTDIAKSRENQRPAEVIRNWLRNPTTIDFLHLWENVHNPSFKVAPAEHFRDKSTRNGTVISPKEWIEGTNAAGMTSSSGRYGGTFAAYDIAVHFSNWLSPEFYLYFVTEFRRLKTEEAQRLDQAWDLRRELSKSNYHIHTDAVRNNLVPTMEWHTKGEKIRFASEADMLNMAVFGMTAKEWKIHSGGKKGNLRNNATEIELQVMSNMESLNAALIEQQFSTDERLTILTSRAKRELEVLDEVKAVKQRKLLE